MRAVQSEIAQTIAEQSHAKPRPVKGSYPAPPTKDLRRVTIPRAVFLIDPALDDRTRQDVVSGIQFLEAAIAHDPSFLLRIASWPRPTIISTRRSTPWTAGPRIPQ
jgi:hypothetical protein